MREYRLWSAIVPDPHPVSHDDRVAARVSAQARQRELSAALANLAPRDRDVLLLIAWEGLSCEVGQRP